MLQVTLNGKIENFDNSLTIKQLLDKFNLEIDKIAVELNKEIIHRYDFDKLHINQNDNIEIVHFIGGG